MGIRASPRSRPVERRRHRRQRQVRWSILRHRRLPLRWPDRRSFGRDQLEELSVPRLRFMVRLRSCTGQARPQTRSGMLRCIGPSCVVLLLFWASADGTTAAAEGRSRSGSQHAGAEHLRHRNASSAPVSQDAAELATLAPPSSRSTMAQNYGDAAYSRSRVIRGISGTKADSKSPVFGRSDTCDPRMVTSRGYVCGGAQLGARYQQGYAYTPSFLSAPQRVGVPDDVQTPLLSPLAGLAWLANNLRYDPHN